MILFPSRLKTGETHFRRESERVLTFGGAAPGRGDRRLLGMVTVAFSLRIGGLSTQVCSLCKLSLAVHSRERLCMASYMCVCMYSRPLNNTGLNCTGPLTRGFCFSIKNFVSRPFAVGFNPLQIENSNFAWAMAYSHPWSPSHCFPGVESQLQIENSIFAFAATDSHLQMEKSFWNQSWLNPQMPRADCSYVFSGVKSYTD